MDAVKDCIAQIRSHTNFDFYIVGGCIRDLLLKREAKDIDLVFKEDISSIAKKFACQQEGSFLVLNEANDGAKVTLKDGNMAINFSRMKGENIVKDLAEKNFTMNAMALKVGKEGAIHPEDIIDPFTGKKDIQQKLVRMVSEKIFQEDPLRMMGAVRLAAQFNFEIEDSTAEAIKKHADFLTTVPPEGISRELFQILKCSRTHHYFNIMDKNLNLLNKIFPEIEPMKEVGQCKYHVVDAWTHSLYTLNVAEEIIYANGYFENHLRRAYEGHMDQVLADTHTRLQLVKLAALFHDVGKPAARKVDETGRVRFKGHETVGMEIMMGIADRLQLSAKEKQYLCKMVKEHMWPLTLYKDNDVSGKALYDLFKNFGEDTLDVLLVSLADIIATRKLLYPQEEMGMYKIHIEYLANNYLTRFKNISDISHVLNRNEIMEHFRIEDQGQIEQMMEEIRRAIFFGKIPPEKERAIQYLREHALV
ncbi:HD domain-containing protein [Thermotalea metallivorans]|uniref:Multifunctional CCA protein n=1 Tax=Thermotalea metallivorans TaxID=520762 RepID=A0A140L0S9_9FIRM|nr:HD domain-containing protein [Thermotalea metallivorans]KXG74154.1 Multifunctional CCA protein [Thermotalea metallivorans]